MIPETDEDRMIRAIKCCVSDPDGKRNCDICPYEEVQVNGGHCQNRMHTDAYRVFNERCKTGHWIVLTMCANEGIYCSECSVKVFDFVTKPKKKLSQYCPHCGSRNEQFFKDGEVVFR